MSEIDYGADGGSIFHAPVMRIDDDGHGFVGVVYEATTRQGVDFESDKLKWFHNKQLIKTNEPPAGAQPVNDYVFHIAVEKGRGAFTVRDAEGEPVKLSSGKNKVEPRAVETEDIAVVASAAWFARAVKSVKLNTGHKVRFKRLTPARDENGDRMTDVRCEIEILDTVSDPKPYDASKAAASADLYGEEPFVSAGAGVSAEEEF